MKNYRNPHRFLKAGEWVAYAKALSEADGCRLPHAAVIIIHIATGARLEDILSLSVKGLFDVEFRPRLLASIPGYNRQIPIPWKSKLGKVIVSWLEECRELSRITPDSKLFTIPRENRLITIQSIYEAHKNFLDAAGMSSKYTSLSAIRNSSLWAYYNLFLCENIDFSPIWLVHLLYTLNDEISRTRNELLLAFSRVYPSADNHDNEHAYQGFRWQLDKEIANGNQNQGA